MVSVATRALRPRWFLAIERLLRIRLVGHGGQRPNRRRLRRSVPIECCLRPSCCFVSVSSIISRFDIRWINSFQKDLLLDNVQLCSPATDLTRSEIHCLETLSASAIYNRSYRTLTYGNAFAETFEPSTPSTIVNVMFESLACNENASLLSLRSGRDTIYTFSNYQKVYQQATLNRFYVLLTPSVSLDTRA